MLRPTGLPAVLRALSKSRGASGRNRVVSSQLFLQPNRRFFFKNDNDDGNNKGSKGGSGKKNDTKGTDNKNKIDDKSIDKGKNDVDKGDTSSGSANFNAKNGGFAAGNGGEGGAPPDGNNGSKPNGDKSDSEFKEATSAIIPTSMEYSLEKMPVGENAPRPPEVVAIPLSRRPVFPGFFAPLVVTDKKLVKALLTIASSKGPFVGLFMLKDPSIDILSDDFQLNNTEQIHKIGVLAHIQQIDSGPAGAVVLVMAHRRIEITETSDSTTFPLTVKVNHITPTPFSSPEFKDKVNTVRASCNEILSTVRDIVKINPLFQQHISYFARKIDVTNPYALADFAASLTSLDANELQEVLETVPLEERLSKALILLKKELQLASLQAEIKADIEKRFHEQNRKYFLNEQLKTIKTELGLEKDDKEALFTKFEDRVAKLDMPATARQVYKEELDKLMSLEKNSSEFNVTSTYLDWLTNIPWGKYSVDNLNITRAREILDAEHFGLSDVKDRIVEFIAMAKLTGTVQGKILCLVGPPGVGKTSIGKSIADALGRKFYRFSVGGLSDVAEIKGHRRTYIGALPGKIIQCFKATGVSNPLVLIDEIDKIGTARGHSGDPSSALLELLDPSQNSSFMDHYLDTPVDVSKVLFICTANSLETLPGPLIDRMEIIRLSGYDFNEKIEIAKKYLDQKIRQEMGLLKDDPATPRSVEITEEALDHLIRGYARESGVRNLEKLMQKIYRKIAVELIAKREKAIPSSFDDDIITSTATSLLEAGVTPPPTEAAKKESISDDKSALADSSKPETRTKKTLSSLTSIVALQDEDAFQRELSPEDATALRQRIAAQYKKEREELQRLIEKKREEEKKAWADLAIEDEQWTVHKDNLQKYVGKPVFTTDRLYALPPAGVIMGLAWTQMGGSALYIEVSSPYLRPSNITEKNKKPAKKQLKGKNKGPIGNDVIQDTYTPPPSGSHDGRDGDDDSKHEPSPYGGREVFDGDAAGDDHDADVSLPTGGSLRLTGKMGEVMQESAQIAYTFARQYLRTVEGHRYNDYLDTIPVHLHIPEGATPKDGPSAGVTMVSALLSLALDKPPRPDVAMTGEIDLKGTVLSVGGIKEKVMAARRAGITTIVIPATNERDYAELPDHFKEDVTIHFAKTYEDVYKVVFDYDQSVVDKEIERQKQHALK